MIGKRKVAVVTGSRAEYGLLYWVMKCIEEDPELSLLVIATGMHLSPEFGMTYRAIEVDGFSIDAKVEMLLSSDTSVGVAKSIGLGVIGFADAFDRLAPDVVVLLGDRFEIMAAAQAAMILQIPIAHLAGGDSGAGTYDNIIRSCISEMASLHFVTHELARKNLVRIGVPPKNIYNYGATSVENIFNLNLLSREAIEHDLNLKFKGIIVLMTFHPLTMGGESGEKQLKALLEALDRLRSRADCTIIITKPNADNGGRALIEIIANYVAVHDDCYLFDSLGQLRYLSIMRQADMVVGNSSSGIYEAPYLGTPTVDIGERQKGRTAPASVVRCEADVNLIESAIRKALVVDFSNVDMVYGDGGASPKIVNQIKKSLFLAPSHVGPCEH